MVDWISVIVIGAVVIFFIAVMYKGLREPINLILGWIGRMFGAVGGTAASAASGTGEVVTYG